MNKSLGGWVSAALILPIAVVGQMDAGWAQSADMTKKPVLELTGPIPSVPGPAAGVPGPLPGGAGPVPGMPEPVAGMPPPDGPMGGPDLMPTTFDKIEVSGSAFAGYFNDGYGSDGPMLRSDINFKAAHKFDNGVAIGFSTDIDLIAAGKDPYAQVVKTPSAYLDDYTIWADFGNFGKLSYTTEGHCVSEDAPWVDGEIYSENNTSVWHLIAPNFRCVGGVAPMLKFPGYAVPADDYFKYEYRSGRFALDAYYDNNLAFTDHISGKKFSGKDTATVFGGALPAQTEVSVGYRFDFATVSVGANDLQDRYLRLIKFMPQYGLMMIGTREWRHGDGNNPLTVLLVDWTPRDMGIFRGVSLEAYLDNSDPMHTESYIGQLKLGTDVWQTGFSMDSDKNWALEAAYKINEKTSLRLGYDNGLNGHNGKDRFYAPHPDPVIGFRDAPDRGAAWEIGLEMRF